MNLKDFLSNREKPPELYWSLVIEKDWVQAGIWYISKDVAEMVNISPPAGWSHESELVEACDAALSSAVSQLPENYSEPNKTVFGVASAWVKGGEITDEHLAKIKKVCTDLSLTPVGFVVLPEAIANLYKAQEESPLSAVILGLASENLEVSVFKMGNLVGTTSVSRSISLVEDVTEGLSRFEGAMPLPSRVVIYDGKGGELETAREELMKTSWEEVEKVKFLHTPKVEILVSDKKVIAISLAGASEIGQVSQVNLQEVDKDKKPEEVPVESILPEREELENVKTPDDPPTAEELGFVVGEDITQKELKVTPTKVSQKIEKPNFSAQNVDALPVKNSPKNDYLQKTKKLFHGFSSKIKFPQVAFSGQKTNPFFYAIFFVLLVVAIALAYLWFVPKATITVYVSPKTFQEQVGLLFNTDGKYDGSHGIIPATAITASETGEKTKSTTGTKLVGDKASGSVQIANGNGNPIHLASGTVLTSSGGLKFVTTAEASVSGQLIPGSPGTATINVTASDIGAQYNLAKGEIFKVGVFDRSQVAGTSQADFSGGSSQQLAAVSDSDQKKLQDELKQELSSKVMDELNSKVSGDQVFVNDLSGINISSETFDKKIGEVADTLKLSLTITAKGVAADRTKLLQYTVDSLKSKIPQGYALKSSEINFKFVYVGEKDGNLSYNADINANFLPYLATSELAKKISGKSLASVEDYLKTIPGYSNAEIKLNPPLPGPFRSLPHQSKNISINLISE